MSKLKNIVGNTYGRLTVIEFKGMRGEFSLWECSCICGKKKIVTKNALTMGNTSSCGCLSRENRVRNGRKVGKLFTHGETRSRIFSTEWRSWQCMINRCENPHHKSFFNYGMRGIVVCERWRHSFENFLSDMGRKPTPKHSIDRIDNDRGYSPENCRWATMKEQQINKRNNRWLEYKGVKMVMSHWANHLGISIRTLDRQLKTRTLTEIIATR